jgi:hypothetical protein
MHGCMRRISCMAVLQQLLLAAMCTVTCAACVVSWQRLWKQLAAMQGCWELVMCVPAVGLLRVKQLHVQHAHGCVHTAATLCGLLWILVGIYHRTRAWLSSIICMLIALGCAVAATA